jgi:hypothetical protein
MNSKEDLNNSIRHLINNFLIGIITNKLMSDEMWLKIKDEKPQFSSGTGDSIYANIDELSLLMLDIERKHIAVEEFEKSLKRSLLRECHEIILLYCENTRQLQKYKSTTWFQFARILRNSISHKEGGRLRNWPQDLKKKNITEVKWRNYHLNETLIGHDIQFTHYDTLLLTIDQMEFVEKILD